ncbi:TRAP transporter small permease [Falsihalocynthiibacter sp. S25ZX9]|uniref:TRAP transporter small permease n=1 Tax=Falsihalocynthiibacter sp. S25ZX9 TaxID=3240870 RepID=UPI003510B599
MIVTTLRKIQGWVVTTAILANVTGALVLFALVIIMNMDVISRGVFHAPMRGVVEVAIFSLILIVFLQLPDVVRTNRLTRSDGFLMYLALTRPRIGKVLTRFIDAVSCLFMALIVWTVWPEFVHAWESCYFFSAPDIGQQPTGAFWPDLKTAMNRCDYFGTPGILTAPWWPARLAIAFGAFFSAVIFFFKAVLGDDLTLKPQTGKAWK